MSEAITGRLKRDRRGISNVVVVMLSLVLIVIIVGNVVLWSYQMNQFDLERMQEKVELLNVTRVNRSPWSTAKNEYLISAGCRQSGTYADTTTADGLAEVFEEDKAQVFRPSSYAVGGFTQPVSGELSSLAAADGRCMSFRSFPNYEFKYAESIEVSSTTGTAYVDKAVITFTPQATANFTVVAAAEVQCSSTGGRAKARLTLDSASCQELVYHAKDTTDWYPFCGLKRATLVQGQEHTFKLQFSTSGTGERTYIRNARLVLFSLESEYAESEELSTTSSTDWQTKATLTLAPQATASYLIIAAANVRMSRTNRDVRVRLVQDDVVVHTENSLCPGSGTTSEYYTFGVMRAVDLTPSAHSLQIQYCSSGTPGVAGVSFAHVAAIKLSQFSDSHYAESEQESTPIAPNMWMDKVVNAYTSNSGKYLVMGSASYKSGQTSSPVSLSFDADLTPKQSAQVEHRSSSNYESAFFMTTQESSAGSRTDRIRWMAGNTAARVRNARLISCMLPEPVQTMEACFAGESNTYDWTRLEWTLTISQFTTESVNSTFQLYDFQNDSYPLSGDGYASFTGGAAGVAVNQTITSEPTRFRNSSDGQWKAKIHATVSSDESFEAWIDCIEYRPTSSDFFWLDIAGEFMIDLATYPLSSIKGLELMLKYNVTGQPERWRLKTYNWTGQVFVSDIQGSLPVIGEWNDYTLNFTDGWHDFVNDRGMLTVGFVDEGLNVTKASIQVDFLGVRVLLDGACFDLRNSGPFTTHVVAVWIVNATRHERFNANLFINSGAAVSYVRADISLPEDNCTAKIVTEKGNVAVFP